MGPSLCKLTIVCPRSVGPIIAEAFDDAAPAMPGYTIFHGSGHGPDAQLASASEQVLGAMETAMFIIVLPEERVESVKELVRATCQRPQIAYWVEPVLDYGRLVR